jgi:hypothetical protein
VQSGSKLGQYTISILITDINGFRYFGIICVADVYAAMNQQHTKALGIALVVISVILFFVSWQQYSDNAGAVEAMNAMGFGALPGVGQMTPSMPASSKYALLFGVLSLIGGGVALSKASRVSVDHVAA